MDSKIMSRFRSMHEQFLSHFNRRTASVIATLLYSRNSIAIMECDKIKESQTSEEAVSTLLRILTARGESAVQEFANVLESSEIELPKLAQELRGVAVAVTSQQNLPASQQRQRSQASQHATLGEAFRGASDELVNNLTNEEVDMISRKLYSLNFILNAELQKIQSQSTPWTKASCLIDIIGIKGDVCIQALEDILRNHTCRANLADLIRI